MSDAKASTLDEAELTAAEIAEIEEYETKLDLNTINRELADHGINPVPMIQAVKNMADEHLAKYRQDRLAKAKR